MKTLDNSHFKPEERQSMSSCPSDCCLNCNQSKETIHYTFSTNPTTHHLSRCYRQFMQPKGNVTSRHVVIVIMFRDATARPSIPSRHTRRVTPFGILQASCCGMATENLSAFTDFSYSKLAIWSRLEETAPLWSLLFSAT